MLYTIRFAKYDPDMWREEFIGYVFNDKPEVQYALCIKDMTSTDWLNNQVSYYKDTWYAWGEVNGAI